MMNPPLKLQVMGGLGNQLFGLAAGIAIAGNTNRDLIIDFSRVFFGSNLTRTPQLSQLLIPHPHINVSFQHGSTSYFDRKYEAIRRHSKGWLKSRLNFETPDYWDSLEEPTSQLKEISNSVGTLCGPFMNFNWADIALNFGFPRTCFPIYGSEGFKVEYSKIEVEDVALHIRLGDYAAHSEIFPFASEKYYIEALNLVSDIESRRLTIFSDSPKLIPKLYPNLMNMKKLRIMDSNLTPMETMSLMSTHRTLITSNSTFSSWGGWFGEKDLVVTPVPHHLDNWQDQLPINWIRLPI